MDLPAGTYGFAIRGPWRLTSDPYLVALAGEDGPVPLRHWYYVEPAPDQPGPGGPGAGPAPREELAATGTDVGWLALAGLVALLAGTVLVRRARA
ncbi:MAG: LPXTG cell wall anchor domain-containing protein [Saccharothrix sp.]|nr:LPXTG cell wall anchor domain-containing protein [Saccharothrix sp.]